MTIPTIILRAIAWGEPKPAQAGFQLVTSSYVRSALS